VGSQELSQVEITRTGSLLEIRLNDELAISVNDSTNTTGMFRFGSTDCNVEYDDIPLPFVHEHLESYPAASLCTLHPPSGPWQISSLGTGGSATIESSGPSAIDTVGAPCTQANACTAGAITAAHATLAGSTATQANAATAAAMAMAHGLAGTATAQANQSTA